MFNKKIYQNMGLSFFMFKDIGILDTSIALVDNIFDISANQIK